MGIGGLWVPRDEKKVLTKRLQSLRMEIGLTGEIKWTKVSSSKLDSYKKLINFFLESDPLRFRAIEVEKAKVDQASHDKREEDLGFYNFYYEMLIKWMVSPHRISFCWM